MNSLSQIFINLQPKQNELFNLIRQSSATWIGFGGSRGGSKSHGTRAAMLALLLSESTEQSRVCILRRTYDLVRETHIEPIFAQFPFMRSWYRVGDKELWFPNGSVLAFRHAENAADVDGMIGKQYRHFVVDQAEAFSERELNVMKSCTRWPGVDDTACKFILTFNPGGIGNVFLKRIFYDRKYHAGERDTDYAFIQAYAWDNVQWALSALRMDGLPESCNLGNCRLTLPQPQWCASCTYYSWDDNKRFDYFLNRTQYGRELNALPQALRIGWLLGRMDQFAGQYYDFFSPERHIRPCKPESWATCWLGIDWGFAHESVCCWLSQLDEKLTGVYREFAGAGRSPKSLAQEIVDRTGLEERRHIKHIFLSHDAFSKRDERDTIAEQMAEVFRANGMPYPEMATKDVIGRAALLYDLLGPLDPVTNEKRAPQIVLDPSCKRIIETLPLVCRDPDNPERTLKFDGDDPIDALWYGLTYRMRQTQKPAEVKLMEEANRITDPIARWFFLRKNQSRKPKPILQPIVRMPWEG